MLNIDNDFTILLYISLWICFLIYFFKISNWKTLGFSLIILYFSQAIVAFLLYNNKNYVDGNQQLSVFPFIYLFFILFITLVPLIRLGENKIIALQIPEHSLITSLCTFFVFFSIINIIEVLPQLPQGIAMLSTTNNEGILDLYNESTLANKASKNFSGAFSFIGVFSSLAQHLMPLLFYSYLIKIKRNTWLMILLSISLLQGPLLGVAHASRFELIGHIFILFLMYFFFRPYIKKRDKHIIQKGGIVFFSLLTTIFLIVSIARSDGSDNESVAFNLESYYAQGPLNFNIYCMDANGTREGHKVIPLLLYFSGEKSLSPEELRFRYRNMSIDSSRFSTYVGDFVLDFGPAITIVLFLLISLFSLHILRHKHVLNYGQIVLIYILVKICGSFYQYGFSNVGGNVALVTLIFLSILFLKNNPINYKQETVSRKTI